MNTRPEITGYLVNPFDSTIQPIQLAYSGEDRGYLPAIYKAIDCDRVDCSHLDDQHDLWVDDEGLFKAVDLGIGMGTPNTKDFVFFAGKGLILSADENGESVSPTLPLVHFASLFSVAAPMRDRKGNIAYITENFRVITAF